MVQLTILYTADIQAHVDQLLRVAYMAQVQRYELNAVGHHTLLVDAGQVEDRALIESDLSKGAAMFRLLKAAGYDASAIGNAAAMWYGPQSLLAIARASEVPLLCANMLTRQPQPIPVPGTHATLILERGPVRVGLLGLTTDMDGLYEQFYPVRMPDVLETAHYHANALRAQGCNVIGVLSHLGYDQDIELARTVPGLNFIIGGHSHTVLKHPTDVGGVPVCHAGDFGNFLGRLDLTLDNANNVTKWFGQVLRVSSERPKHAAAEQMWEKIRTETETKLSQPVGHLNESVDLASDRACGIGQLLADALRARLRTDIAMCVTGHVQTGLAAGSITLGDLVRACRSPANAGVVNLTGQQIIHALEHGASPTVWQQMSRLTRGTMTGILQASGMTYNLNPMAPPGERVSEIKILGKPIDPKATYLVAATDYELMPVRGYFSDLDPNVITFDMPWVMREVLHGHLERFNPLTPGTRARITIPDQDTEVYIGPTITESASSPKRGTSPLGTGEYTPRPPRTNGDDSPPQRISTQPIDEEENGKDADKDGKDGTKSDDKP
ncbi:MAG: bifunctional metallophosphatase/5'-nucleotidase [Chloroflexi bacterium]|nr:bifunctional metallophosphatase/5'-nucleotidase [Chloroflexota bacterium]